MSPLLSTRSFPASQAPERVWQQQQARLSTQRVVLNSISSNLSTLQDRVNALKDVLGAITSNVASSSQNGIVMGTAQSSAASGTHTVIVQSLATTSSYYTEPATSGSATFSTGTFTLKVGNTSTDIPVDANNNTLDGLASYINGHELGVTAGVINDLNGARLALVSTASGEPGDLSVTGKTTGLIFTKAAAGVNASFSIDGVPLNSTTNTVTGALAAVTLNLVSAAPGIPVLLTVGADTARATQAVNAFVASYNTVMGAINSQFTFDPVANTAGPLAANSSLRSLQGSLLSDVTFSRSGNNGYVNLASLGVNMANDGTFSVDSVKLNEVISNHLTDFQNFFQSLGPNGFANKFSTDLASLTDATDGIINVNLAENGSTQATLTAEITDFEDRLVGRRQQLINNTARWMPCWGSFRSSWRRSPASSPHCQSDIYEHGCEARLSRIRRA